MFYSKNLNWPEIITSDLVNELVSLKTSKPDGSRKYLYVSTDTEYFLSKEIKSFFKDLGVFPHVMILFGHHNDILKSKLDPHVHTDVFLKDGHWVKNPFAVNLELTPSMALIKWWNTGSTLELYPEAVPKDLDHDLGNGIHYGSVKNGKTDDYLCLAQSALTSKNPVLIRTNVPHCVYYPSGFVSRLSISLRFPIEQIPTFETAYKIF